MKRKQVSDVVMNADYLSAGSQGGCGGVNLTPAFNGTIKVAVICTKLWI